MFCVCIEVLLASVLNKKQSTVEIVVFHVILFHAEPLAVDKVHVNTVSCLSVSHSYTLRSEVQ